MTRPRYPSDLKPRKRLRSNIVQVLLDPDTAAQVKRLAADSGKSVSAWCAEVLKDRVHR